MLTTLETGVKGGKWFSLIDKVSSEANLYWAFVQVARNKGAAGVDRVTIDDFTRRQSQHLKRLTETLTSGDYRPQAVRRVWIPKPGGKEKRPLGIPTVRDRVVQTALRNVIEPIFERDFAEHSYGFRPGRGCKDALRRVEGLLKDGYTYVVDADLKSYFDTIPHDRLMASDGFQMVRYADDFVILCRSREDAERALAAVGAWTAEAGLELHPVKTCIVDVRSESFDFLGYHFCGEQRWPRKKSLKKVRAEIRAKTRRTSGHSLHYVIRDVNFTLRGWFEYFKHSHPWTFERLDGWIRMRLRSILRRRCGRRGRGRGLDHQRWPNAYFAKHGLFSMVTAYRLASQSSKR
ncbi:MAG: group II intron reverse transcriptase/maturase [Planctomycetes bacterium]|nr:group II intron reverse transcriptase/maturase [Planctomycetota bacterium]